MFERAGVITTGLAFLALTLAGCAVDDDFENLTGATGTVTFCVQDENNVSFNGVFVNFGDIEINQETNVNVDDTDVATDDTGATGTDETDTGTTGAETTGPTETNDTSTNATTTETETATGTTTNDTDTMTAGPDEGEAATPIQVADIDCVRTAVGGFDIGDADARGQAYGNDRTADTNDAQADDDEGIGNDDGDLGRGRGPGPDDGETERVNVEVDEVDLLQFQDRSAAFLAEAQVKPGTFRNVMIDVESVRVTTDDGEDREIDVDLKKIHLKGPIEVREDQNTLIVFKVDLERSIVSTGSGDVRFKPVMHVQVTAPQVQEIVIRETAVTTSADNETGTNTTTTATSTATATGTTTHTATATTEATATTSPTTAATATTSPTATTPS